LNATKEQASSLRKWDPTLLGETLLVFVYPNALVEAQLLSRPPFGLVSRLLGAAPRQAQQQAASSQGHAAVEEEASVLWPTEARYSSSAVAFLAARYSSSAAAFSAVH